MSRPTRQGLDYFPLDTDFDGDMELLIADKGAYALSVIVTVKQLIFKNNGYYVEDCIDTYLLIKRRIMVDIEIIKDIINAATERKIFDEGMRRDHKILTSKEIQKLYFLAAARKKTVNVYNNYLLVGVNDYKNVRCEEVEGVNVGNNATKEKEKEKENKKQKRKGKDSGLNVDLNSPDSNGNGKIEKTDFSFSSDAVEKKQDDGSKSAVKTTSDNDDLKGFLFEYGFWRNYPEKNGKKVGMAEAKVLCLKLNVLELYSRCIASKNYKESKRLKGGIAPKDPVGFLKDGYWKDWLEPECVGSSKEKPVVYIHASKPRDRTPEEIARRKKIITDAKLLAQEKTGRKIFRNSTSTVPA